MFSIMQFLLTAFLLIYFVLYGLRLARNRLGDDSVRFADRVIALVFFFSGALALLAIDYCVA